ncbi:Putative pterin 4 alpha carbinolamine dehydratase [Septoria linicola]|uniref:4a-hydroxytetrahydrobiopterin dehydratase n=1 Tax=Septoria linicola TaxID=215465 RepID=A0A9Q9AT96_9PEZI|nr:putative pterin 4 alpha carbinolamine dehydratase [Septoria linicola]USW55402.1 Putative pterin 4 alpha carbinolamine dehydratase [Septoria linicola]
MIKAEEISVSAGDDPQSITEQATELVTQGKWQLCNEGKGIERGFKFKTFKATWSFMDQVAEECKKQKHHPEWSNVYNKTHIRWTTHNPEGLSSKDTAMARFCDQAAKEFNELDVPSSECKLGVDGKVKAGDCCTPKKA